MLGFVILVGLAIGSFLNVVIYRVPLGLSVVSPPSACPGCAGQISARDNIPVLGWVLLRGRCRGCAEPIGVRYPLVELLTAGVFLVLGLRLGVVAALPAYLFFGAVSVALAMIDLDVKRLPDVLTLPSYPVGVVLLALGSLYAGEGDLLRALLGGVAMFAVYFALCFAYPAGMGFGDVKLSGVVGLFTAWLGWDVWAVGLILGFLLGGVAGIAVMLSGRGGRKTALPFGPFMLLGALLSIVAGVPLAAGYLSITVGA